MWEGVTTEVTASERREEEKTQKSTTETLLTSAKTVVILAGFRYFATLNVSIHGFGCIWRGACVILLEMWQNPSQKDEPRN